MRRRDLVLATQCPAPHAPVDDVKLNAFVNEYNEYVTRLMRGQLDLKQWARVLKRWEALQ